MQEKKQAQAQHKVCSQVRYRQCVLPWRPGGRGTKRSRTWGQQLSPCAKKRPQPQTELLPLSTAAAGTAGPGHTWWQISLVTRQSKGRFKYFPITQPEMAQ